jgi:hypothetical protein
VGTLSTEKDRVKKDSTQNEASLHAADSTFDAGFEFSIIHYQFSLFPPGERLEFFILHYGASERELSQIIKTPRAA